jgi:hypothetical protein
MAAVSASMQKCVVQNSQNILREKCDKGYLFTDKIFRNKYLIKMLKYKDSFCNKLM